MKNKQVWIHKHGKCCICEPIDTEALNVNSELMQNMRKYLSTDSKTNSEKYDERHEVVNFFQILKIIYKTKYRTHEVTKKCKHESLQKNFMKNLECNQKQLNSISNRIGWKLGKYNFHVDVLSQQCKTFTRHILQINKFNKRKESKNKIKISPKNQSQGNQQQENNQISNSNQFRNVTKNNQHIVEEQQEIKSLSSEDQSQHQGKVEEIEPSLQESHRGSRYRLREKQKLKQKITIRQKAKQKEKGKSILKPKSVEQEKTKSKSEKLAQQGKAKKEQSKLTLSQQQKFIAESLQKYKQNYKKFASHQFYQQKQKQLQYINPYKTQYPYPYPYPYPDSHHPYPRPPPPYQDPLYHMQYYQRGFPYNPNSFFMPPLYNPNSYHGNGGNKNLKTEQEKIKTNNHYNQNRSQSNDYGSKESLQK